MITLFYSIHLLLKVRKLFQVLVHLCSGKPPVSISDPALQAKVDNWERVVLTQSKEVIGYSKTPIYSDRQYCWYGECNGASLMADAALWFLSKNESNTQAWANSPAAAVWHGGALADTDLDISPGKKT